jgi:hypothetical protein
VQGHHQHAGISPSQRLAEQLSADLVEARRDGVELRQQLSRMQAERQLAVEQRDAAEAEAQGLREALRRQLAEALENSTSQRAAVEADSAWLERHLRQVEVELRESLAERASLKAEVELLRRRAAEHTVSSEQQGHRHPHTQQFRREQLAASRLHDSTEGAMRAAQEQIAALRSQLQEQRAAAAAAAGEAEALGQQMAALQVQLKAEAAADAALRRRMASAGAATALFAQQQGAQVAALQQQLAAQLARGVALEQALAGERRRAVCLEDALLELTKGSMKGSQAQASEPATAGSSSGKRAESPGEDGGTAMAARPPPHKGPAHKEPGERPCGEGHSQLPAALPAAPELEQGMAGELAAAQERELGQIAELAAPQTEQPALGLKGQLTAVQEQELGSIAGQAAAQTDQSGLEGGLTAVQEREPGQRAEARAAQEQKQSLMAELMGAQQREQSLQRNLAAAQGELGGLDEAVHTCQHQPLGQLDAEASEAQALQAQLDEAEGETLRAQQEAQALQAQLDTVRREQQQEAAKAQLLEQRIVELAAEQPKLEELQTPLGIALHAVQATADEAGEQLQAQAGFKPMPEEQLAASKPMLATQEEQLAASQQAAVEPLLEFAAATDECQAARPGMVEAEAERAAAALNVQSSWEVAAAVPGNGRKAAAAAQPVGLDLTGQCEEMDSQDAQPQDVASAAREQHSGMQAGTAPGRDIRHGGPAAAFHERVHVQAAAAASCSTPILIGSSGREGSSSADALSSSADGGGEAAALRRRVRELEGHVESLLERLAQLERDRCALPADNAVKLPPWSLLLSLPLLRGHTNCPAPRPEGSCTLCAPAQQVGGQPAPC